MAPLVACVPDSMDRRTAEAAQAYLAAIVESSDDAILSKDLDGIIQSCNAAAERIFGYPGAELVGKPVRMLIPPERQGEEDDILARIRRGERVTHFETVRLTKDQRRIDISLTISPVRDADGRIIGASKIARDITEEKRSRAARGYLAAIVESSEDAILAKDLNGIIQSCNARAEQVFGYKAEELVGRSIRMIIPPERQAEEDDILARIRRGEHIDHFETVRLTKTGHPLDISLSVSPIRDRDGHIIGIAKIARDISEQKRLERELAAQREWFRVTLDSIGDAVIATDIQSRVVFMNPIAELLTGWNLADARGKPCTGIFNIINENSRQVAANPVTRVLAEGTVVGLANHTVLIAADGTERPIDDSGAPIRSRDGRVVGVVLVFRDVTERRRGEIDRRDAALERERLLEAERAARADAERASRVKDEFVAMVSHELRTPLNAILGWTQLMVQPGTGPEVIARAINVISRNTRLQAQLISDLLDISRIVSGKLRLDIEQVDLASVVNDAVDTVQRDADDKKIVIQRDLDRSAGPIAGDPARVQQMVWNLLSNAIKFTPEGGLISVRLRRAGADAEIIVTDNGVGIRPDFLPHLFDRFKQADQSITRRFGGLGLGLSIVKNLVELHGGSITAESGGLDHGATFTIALPSSAGARGVDRPPSQVAANDAAQPQDSLSGIRVLVVEDEPDTCEFLDRFLRGYGAVVVVARTAEEALSRLSGERVDIVVSDIGLPDVDGYDLMQRVRQLPASAGGAVPAIALTAYARTEDRTRAFRAGYQAHLAKPIESAELVATIASFAGLIEARRKSRQAGDATG
jgi:PAS domain S-box-containing protein